MERVPTRNRQSGFTLLEAIVTVTIGTVILLGIYSLWRHNQVETLRLKAKIDARNNLILSTKSLSQSITLAGFGIPGVPSLSKKDQIGSDTLILYINESEATTTLASNYSRISTAVNVMDATVFANAAYIAIQQGDRGEIRMVAGKSSNYILLNKAFDANYDMASARVYPATRQKFYTDQANEQLVCVVNGTPRIVGKQVRNFQVSFQDKDGNATEDVAKIRNVTYSLSGEYEPIRGELNSLVFTNTAIPRNLL